ncbi:hypothetical protein PQX77_003121, partial [Marasmius sp. AFHP31]
LGVIAIIITLIGNLDPDGYNLASHGNSIRIGYNGAFAGANLLVTVCTASRIWRLSREESEFLSSGTRNLYMRVLAIILESGLLYPVSSFAAIGLNQSASEIGVPIELMPTVPLIAGIAPALMIVRCQIFNALQNRTVREAGTLSTLRFNSNAGVAANPQTDSQARDVEAQSELSSSEANDPMGDSSTHYKEKGMNACLSNSPRVI